MSEIVTIYTDGACSGNPGKGGWGAILLWGSQSKEISGSDGYTTNNKMELLAVIESLKFLDVPSDIIVYTDSTYVKNGISDWIQRWKLNGWNTANKKPVKNKELWQELELQTARHKSLIWRWVKGHAGDPNNEIADRLAREAIEKVE